MLEDSDDDDEELEVLVAVDSDDHDSLLSEDMLSDERLE